MGLRNVSQLATAVGAADERGGRITAGSLDVCGRQCVNEGRTVVRDGLVLGDGVRGTGGDCSWPGDVEGERKWVGRIVEVLREECRGSNLAWDWVWVVGQGVIVGAIVDTLGIDPNPTIWAHRVRCLVLM